MIYNFRYKSFVNKLIKKNFFINKFIVKTELINKIINDKLND